MTPTCHTSQLELVLLPGFDARLDVLVHVVTEPDLILLLLPLVCVPLVDLRKGGEDVGKCRRKY